MSYNQGYNPHKFNISETLPKFSVSKVIVESLLSIVHHFYKDNNQKHILFNSNAIGILECYVFTEVNNF